GALKIGSRPLKTKANNTEARCAQRDTLNREPSRRVLIGCFLAFACFLPRAFAADATRELPPPDYFAGQYEVIGRLPDSTAPYSGTVELKPTGKDQFIMIRKIAGHESKGSAVLDHADPPAGRPAVLRIRFIERGHEFEGTFLWRSDLDNY